MSKMEQLFKDEKLLEKVVSAESREDAKKACKAGGVELSDSDLDEIAGGLNKITKRVLQVLGVAATAATAAAGIGVAGKKLGWWDKKPNKDVQVKPNEPIELMPLTPTPESDK